MSIRSSARGIGVCGSLPARSQSEVGSVKLAGQGAIAQLGERLLCKQEVAGSIPAGSTSFPPTCVRRVMTRARANRSDERLKRRSAEGFQHVLA